MADAERNRHWLELYREAVLEPDRQKMSTLVAQAHTAIQSRIRELWYAITFHQRAAPTGRGFRFPGNTPHDAVNT